MNGLLGVTVQPYSRLPTAVDPRWNAMSNEDWVPAVMASDYDGCLHIVALTDEVEDWEVTVTTEDGGKEVVECQAARGFYHYPGLRDRPSWFVDHGANWELRVAGKRVTDLRGARTGKVPEDDPLSGVVTREPPGTTPS